MTLADSKHHVVTVTVETEDLGGGETSTTIDRISFDCSAPEDAKCRTYPTCDCETFYQDPKRPGYDYRGHAYEPGRECWVATWFHEDAHAYVGPDAVEWSDHGVPAVERSGHVEVVAFDEQPEWRWAP